MKDYEVQPEWTLIHYLRNKCILFVFVVDEKIYMIQLIVVVHELFNYL